MQICCFLLTSCKPEITVLPFVRTANIVFISFCVRMFVRCIFVHPWSAVITAFFPNPSFMLIPCCILLQASMKGEPTCSVPVLFHFFRQRGGCGNLQQWLHTCPAVTSHVFSSDCSHCTVFCTTCQCCQKWMVNMTYSYGSLFYFFLGLFNLCLPAFKSKCSRRWPDLNSHACTWVGRRYPFRPCIHLTAAARLADE